MNTNLKSRPKGPEERHKSDFANGANCAEALDFPPGDLAQSGAQQSARPTASSAWNFSPNDLGEPLTIDEVAELLGCSPWTVRQRYLGQGLPHLQASARGKLVFFRQQVVAWIEKRQRQKGGPSR